jgi:DNA-binding LacI/PurR family transcriptional regulator
MHPTIIDVAKRSHVSFPSVSEILNGGKQHRYAKQTVERVHKAAQELGYEVNHFARSLKKGRTNLIGVTTMGHEVLGEFNNPYAGNIYGGINNFFVRHNYRLIFNNFNNFTSPEQSLNIVKSRMLDGLIYLLFSFDIDKFVKTELPILRNINTPFVVIHSLDMDLGLNCVGLDCKAGGFSATEHLIRHGYRTIGCVGTPATLHCHNLYQGYTQALQQYGLPLEEKFVYSLEDIRGVNSGLGRGYAWAETMLAAQQELPRALFVVDEEYAYGIIKKFGEAGVRIPHQVAIIAFSDINTEAVQLTELTTLAQPASEKGFQAGRRLLELIRQPGSPPATIVLQPALHIRKTCGCL